MALTLFRRGPQKGSTTTALRLAIVVCVLLAASVEVVSAAPSIDETRLLAVDMGADWLKAATLRATISPGKPAALSVDILLNDQTNRKSPPCVAFRCQKRSGEVSCERSFAEEAKALQLRFPMQTVCGPAQLVGFTSEDALRRWAPAAAEEEANSSSVDTADFSLSQADIDAFLYRVEADDREGFSMVLPRDRTKPGDSMTFSAEEMVGMLLGHVKHLVRKADREKNRQVTDQEAAALPAASRKAITNPSVRHAAITIPSHATLAERQAMVDAGALSGLRVVRLVHSVTAAATALAYSKAEQIISANQSAPAFVLVMDMGSRQTEAAVFQFVAIPSALRSGRTRSARGTLTLVSMATNRTLGGKAFDQCIAEYWDREYLLNSVMDASVMEKASPAERLELRKRRAALLRAANQARERLSANKETPVTVEGVQIPGHSEAFTTALSRETFERVCSSLFEAALRVRDEAIARTDGRVGSVADLSRFEVVGGAARMPRMLEIVSKGYRNGVVDRTLNGDEAMAIGTAYLGAVAGSMMPPQFLVREALTNSIGFVISPPLGEDNQLVSRTLYVAHNVTLPAMASARLKNRTDDMVFTIVSPPEVAIETMKESQRTGSSVVCPGCYMNHHKLNVSRAMQKAMSVTKVQSDADVKLTFNSSEVVVETMVSESGLPSVTKAYLLVTYTKEKTIRAKKVAPISPNATVAPVEEEEAMEEEAVPEVVSSGSGDEAVVQDGEDVAQQQAEQPGTDAEPEEAAPRADADVDTDAAAACAEASAPLSEPEIIEVVTTYVERVFPITVRTTGDEPSVKLSSGNTVWLARGINHSPEQLRQSRETLRALAKVDAERYACSLLRNNMESDLIALRTCNAWSNELDISADQMEGKNITDTVREDVLQWRSVVQELSDWLDDEGDVASKELLTQQRHRVAELRKGMQKALGKL